jgi:hypothetical protein
MTQSTPVVVVGYKVFNSDMQCRGYQFAIGGTYKIEGSLKICENGFHFCKALADCFNYYSFNSSNRVAIIHAIGDIDEKGGKCVTSEIVIVKELTWFEVLELVNIGKNCTGFKNTGGCNSGNRNSGNYNSGDYNSGNYNSGNRNSGSYNSGNYNSGYYNSGYYNSGNYNSGKYNSGNYNSGKYNSGKYNSGYYNSGNYNSCNGESGSLNTKQSEFINVFNKPCKRSLFEAFSMPTFMSFSNSMYDISTGKTIALEYKTAFLNSWNSADKIDRMRIKDCPNFDAELFFEISGIDVNAY